MFSEIIKILMLGTSNMEKLPDGIFDELRDLGFVIDQNKDAPSQILEALAIYAPLLKAAKKIPSLNSADLNLSKANPENLIPCPTKASQIFQKIYHAEYFELLESFLAILKAKNWRISEEQLPELLDIGAKHKSLSTIIAAVSGERAKWLAGFNAEWQYILQLSDIDNIDFNLASRSERVAFLINLRKKNPEKAIELISNTWKDEDFQTKLEYLKTLGIASGFYDLPLLELAATESRKELRIEALKLLSSIPESSLTVFVSEFLDKNLFIDNATNGLVFNFEHISFSKTLAEYGFVDNFKALSEGKQANLMAQLIAAVPPSYWLLSRKLSFKTLLEAAFKNDFKSAWFWGLCSAAIKFNDKELQHEIHRFFYKNGDIKAMSFSFDPAFICSNLESDFHNKLCLAYLNKSEMLNHPFLFALLIQRQDWNDALSSSVLEKLKTLSLVQQSGYERYSIKVLDAAALNISDKLLSNCRDGWPEHPAFFWNKQLQIFFEIIDVRILISELKTA